MLYGDHLPCRHCRTTIHPIKMLVWSFSTGKDHSLCRFPWCSIRQPLCLISLQALNADLQIWIRLPAANTLAGALTW